MKVKLAINALSKMECKKVSEDVLSCLVGNRSGILSKFSDTGIHCKTTGMELVDYTTCLYAPAFAGAHCTYSRRDGQAELISVAIT